MKIETYKSTPGLNRILAAKRFTTYRATHKRLLQEDENYRKGHNQYLTAVIVIAVFSSFIWLGSSAIGIAASILLSLIPVAIIVFLTIRQQYYMNQCIGGVLQSQSR